MPDSPGAAAKPEKTMSSRLLTMKFMQRAAASAAAKEPQGSGSDSNPPTPKRPRLSTEPAGPATPQSELDAINAALAAEEEKRREAVARQAAEAGETEWVLDIPAATQHPSQPLVVVADSLDTEGDVLRGGRRSFGNFQRKKKYTQSRPDDEDEEDEDEEMMNPTTPEGVTAMQERRRAKAEARAAKKAQRKHQPVKLSELTSISGSGGPRVGQQMATPPSKKNKNKKKRKSQ